MASVSKTIALFQPAYTEIGIQEVKWINYRPTSQVTNSSALEFNIPGTSPEYVDLGRTYLNIKLKVTHADGSSLMPDENVALTNLALHSLFRQCDVSLNQTIVNPSVGTNHPYKSYLDVLLNYNHSVKEGPLQCEGYAKDTAYYFDRSDNSGHLVRQEWTKESTIVDFQGVLHTDLAQMGRAIISGTQIGLKIYQATDDFRIFSGEQNAEGDIIETCKVSIVDAVLKVCFLKLYPSVLLAQNNRLTRQPAVYPYKRSVVKTYGVARDSYSFILENPFFGERPERVIVGITSSEGYSGSMTRNPFNFHHYKLNYLEFTVDGISVPTVPFTPKYQADSSTGSDGLPERLFNAGYSSEYLSIFQHHYPHDKGLFIHKPDYPAGYCLYSFDIAPTTQKDLFTPKLTGHTRLSGRFDEALPEPVVVVCYAIFPAEFSHRSHPSGVSVDVTTTSTTTTTTTTTTLCRS